MKYQKKPVGDAKIVEAIRQDIWDTHGQLLRESMGCMQTYYLLDFIDEKVLSAISEIRKDERKALISKIFETWVRSDKEYEFNKWLHDLNYQILAE